MELSDIRKLLWSNNTQLIDMEWRIFKEWQKCMNGEVFEAFAYNSIIKRATKEGIDTSNLVNAIK